MRNQTQNQNKTPRILVSEIIDILARLRETSYWMYAVVECGRKQQTFYLLSSESLHYNTYSLCNFFAYLKECLEEHGEVLVKFRYILSLSQFKSNYAIFFEHYIVVEEDCEVI